MKKSLCFFAHTLVILYALCAGVMSAGLACAQESANGDDFMFLMTVRTKQLKAADESGATAYHSDRDAEVAKFLCKTNRVSTADRESKPLSRIPPPADFASMKDAVKAIPALKLNLSEADEFPIWTGDTWVGGIPFILNGFDVPKPVRSDLLRINRWERSAGIYLHSKDERKVGEKYAKLGEPTTLDRIFLQRIVLENGGFEVKFDKTFYIWRLTGTNAPPTVGTP